MYKTTAAILLCLMISKTSTADCFEQAGQNSNIDPDLLRAIAKVESGLNHLAVGKNPGRGFGIGLMQIDSQNFRHLEKFSITPEMLFEPCLNVYAGAYFLRLAVNRLGDNWDAVGAYNAGFSKSRRQALRRSQYASKVRYHYRNIKQK
ncbi:lytic transglycosylase domain-containing protein [Escherichia albertii]|uniref:lytic transglycosylase domain-containing protein n=1 Tax=Escherichia albertii TaxID=208962 RepID=UPI000743890F|nr:lytic transglycosylase domain-containing protein [Escherichia albertii]EGM8072055.1 lytic transglycosylase domain-containing protein [Escherichia albertii]MCU7268819.1 lytic transglycosylase domain-containing protein [Escherichia albertii]MCU7287479.1 lytic transglycosylase domain-containing protein [Escherichia albertii]MCU7325081.1 lytic transglycosylase domain-containing protein [Escherichia albertii]MCZ8631254.1 lytic transglycosylase domain-containing protein [Escherichia albertii]